MRSMITLMIAAILLSTVAVAELQNVEIDGKLVITGQRFDLDDFGVGEATWIQQRTLLGVRADFTDGVSAYIQFDSFNVWGEDFRSDDWESGVDERAMINDNDLPTFGNDDDDMAEVEVYQAFITADDMWGTAIDLKIGRQELVFGSEWLLGNNDDSYKNFGLSYDAIRVDYATDLFTVTGVAAKLAENVMGDLLEEDANMYLLYGSYMGLEDIVIDAYYIFLKDDWNFNNTNMHTVGLRGAGTIGAIDFEAEVAYQDQDEQMADEGYLAANVEVGYTLDMAWMPRLYVGGAYFEADDNGEFNRLFSDVHYSNFHIDAYGNLSDVIIGRIGVDLKPTESICSNLEVIYIEEEDGSDEIGLEIALRNTYQYSEDLSFTLQNAYLMGDDAVNDNDFMYNSISAEISF